MRSRLIEDNGKIIHVMPTPLKCDKGSMMMMMIMVIKAKGFAISKMRIKIIFQVVSEQIHISKRAFTFQ